MGGSPKKSPLRPEKQKSGGASDMYSPGQMLEAGAPASGDFGQSDGGEDLQALFNNLARVREQSAMTWESREKVE